MKNKQKIIIALLSVAVVVAFAEVVVCFALEAEVTAVVAVELAAEVVCAGSLSAAPQAVEAARDRAQITAAVFLRNGFIALSPSLTFYRLYSGLVVAENNGFTPDFMLTP